MFESVLLFTPADPKSPGRLATFLAVTKHLQCVLRRQSRHEAPTDRASLRRGTQGECSSLPPALGWRVLAAATRHMQSCDVFCDDRAATKL